MRGKSRRQWQFGGAGIAEQMRDALVLQKAQERGTPGNAILHVCSSDGG
jgi:hypothetical protein